MIMMMLLVMMMMMMNNQKETELLCHQSAVNSNSVHLMSQKRQDYQKDYNTCEDNNFQFYTQSCSEQTNVDKSKDGNSSLQNSP